MFLSKFIVELFAQLVRKLLFDNVKDHYVPYDVNKRRKFKSFLPVRIDRTQLKIVLSEK